MRILIVSDAWYPQVNGVVRTLSAIQEQLQKHGHPVFVLGPEEGISLPCPTYPEIRLSLRPYKRIKKAFYKFKPDSIHIATEGPLGWAARFFCRRYGYSFTTSFHTKFPEYIEARVGLSPEWTYKALRYFHSPAKSVMYTTPTIERELSAHGFTNLKLWTRGVNVELFRPRPDHECAIQKDRPVALYVGRVAVEKNIEAFLKIPFAGAKYVVGDGPQIGLLKARYPDVHFVGAQFGEDLARYYASADVFVFPSRTDTFGLVLLEALACGVPVAAFPVPGPLDVIKDPRVGCLDEVLEIAVSKALELSRKDCRNYALQYSWAISSGQFFENLCSIHEESVSSAFFAESPLYSSM